MKLDTGTKELLCEVDGRVAIVTLNKPHRKNALGGILMPANPDAAEIANGPSQTLGHLKQNLQLGLTQSLDASLALEAKHMIESGRGD